jgi:site-specific DNA-methyltransferase (adenine-specific)
MKSKTILTQGECLKEMAEIPDAYVDMVLCDLPYGEVTQKSGGLRRLDRGSADKCTIDLSRLVDEYVRICTGSFYLFCGTEQISTLVGHFRRHKLTTRLGAWEKTNPSPMNGTKLWLSGLEFCVYARKPNAVFHEHCKKALWAAPSGRAKIHPTQKPVALMERLISASTNLGAMVLDNCMGSGTTGVACMNLGRNFIGIERDPAYFKIASDRIAEAQRGKLYDAEWSSQSQDCSV